MKQKTTNTLVAFILTTFYMTLVYIFKQDITILIPLILFYVLINDFDNNLT